MQKIHDHIFSPWIFFTVFQNSLNLVPSISCVYVWYWFAYVCMHMCVNGCAWTCVWVCVCWYSPEKSTLGVLLSYFFKLFVFKTGSLTGLEFISLDRLAGWLSTRHMIQSFRLLPPSTLAWRFPWARGWWATSIKHWKLYWKAWALETRERGSHPNGCT